MTGDHRDDDPDRHTVGHSAIAAETYIAIIAPASSELGLCDCCPHRAKA
jgi:hypothetical protein